MIKESKQEAREIIQKRLRTLPQDDYLLASVTVRRRIHEILARLKDADRLNSVLSYTASSIWFEVDVKPLEKQFSDVRFDYVPNNPGAPFPALAYEMILVPLYGFSESGYRLGHGGGWYDKFLATQPQAFKLGVGLESNLVDFTPEPHDIPMDFIVTERRAFTP